MHILVSNDDGYFAPGIKALAEKMKRFGTVTVVAPERNQSGTSNCLTLNQPFTINKIEEGVYSVGGTPSDCVHAALTGLLDARPDLVVSGINCGSNMGDDTLYSGTVAAAVEGHVFGIDAISFSQIQRGWVNLDSAARMAGEIVEKFLNAKSGNSPILLNVNMPCVPYDEFRGIRATRLGRRQNVDPLIMQKNPRGMPIYWLGAAGKPADKAEDTDFWATENGFVSITPLQIDLTSHAMIGAVSKMMS